MGDIGFVFLFASVLLWWWSLGDLLRRKDVEWPTHGLSRFGWGLIVVIGGAFGSIAYLAVGPPAQMGPRRRA